jgi:GntR family transcriptional regulator
MARPSRLLIVSGPTGYHCGMTQPRPRVPLSQQIAADIRTKIESGEYTADVALPSISKLAEQYGVATGTIQKALRILKEQGLIETVPAYGTFVAEHHS